MDKFSARILYRSWLIGLFLIASVIFLLPVFPESSVTYLLEYLFYFAPRWFVFVFLVPVLLFFRHITKLTALGLCLVLAIFIYYQNIQLNVLGADGQHVGAKQVRVMSLNMGGGANLDAIAKTILAKQPDVILLQESGIERLEKLVPNRWYKHCDDRLCFASRYETVKEGDLTRALLQGWGTFASFYLVNFDGIVIPFLNLHLETPRSIITAALHRQFNSFDILDFYQKKALQSSMLNEWMRQRPKFVAAGDFNMPVEESTYQKYFSRFQNAISAAGNGINYTKYTSWHGVRIDHVITSNSVEVINARVLPSTMGDHRIVLVDIVI